MSYSRDLIDKNKIEGVDRVDQSNEDKTEDSIQVATVSSTGVEASGGGSELRTEFGLTERITDIFVNDADGDLLLQQSDRGDRVLQWLQALDMQFIGACRSDERLKPLLKMNTSSSMAEDRLLAQLSQHFETAEVGMLARCFCIPLVSIRVGKIEKQGTLLRPTPTRGNLNLMVLPTSEFRLSFIGDDGNIERLFTLSSRSQCTAVVIDEIPADKSGRSIAIKIPHDRAFYFWCSEKSKLLGIELLAKMKDLLKKKPSIAELTGISQSRLGCFATYLRAYLVGSTFDNKSSSTFVPMDMTKEQFDVACDGKLPYMSMSSKSFRYRHSGGPALKANPIYQSSLSPRSNSFKEGLPKPLISLRDAVKEKMRRRGDNLNVASPIISDLSCSNHSEFDQAQEISTSFPFSSGFLESLCVSPTLSPASQVPCIVSPLLNPYYCWCPPGAPSLQHSAVPSQLRTSEIEMSSLPPLSSLLPASFPTDLFISTPALNLPDVSSINFPALLPDPLVRLPMPTSQQIPTFTPLMCDSIVHIPVIDVCSSGQGYLVSAGPTISTNIPSLHPNFVNPIISETNSMLEKDARETLRLLLSSSSQTDPPLMDVLPAVLTNADKNQSLLVTGSRGLYTGTRDINVFANSFAAMGLASLSGRSTIEDIAKSCSSYDEWDVQPERSSDCGSGNSCSENEDSVVSDSKGKKF